MKQYIVVHGRASKNMKQEEVSTFIDNFIKYHCERAGHPPDENDVIYLRNCQTIRVFANEEGDYIGGYAINIVRPLRYFDVSDYYENYEKRILPILKNSKIPEERDICEISMIWRSEELTGWNMNRMYLASLCDALRTKKKIIIGGSIQPEVVLKFKKVLTETLYFGIVTNKFFGDAKLGHVVFQYRNKLMWRLFLSLLDVILFNTRGFLWVFGKKNIPMRDPETFKDFFSIFKIKKYGK